MVNWTRQTMSQLSEHSRNKSRVGQGTIPLEILGPVGENGNSSWERMTAKPSRGINTEGSYVADNEPDTVDRTRKPIL